MTESTNKHKAFGLTDRAYLDYLYLESVNKEEFIDFLRSKFPKQSYKVMSLSLFKLKITIFNLIKRYESGLL